jgi:Zn-dependent protease/predicted transcriptional regulator
MGATVRLFRVGGIPIAVHASWLAVYGLITWTLAVGYFPRAMPGIEPLAAWIYGLVGALLLFVSVLLHELAHSVVAMAYGLGVRGITLHVFGGVSELDDEPKTARAELVVAAVGPLTSFAIAALLWGTRESGIAQVGPAGAIAGYLVTVNVGIALFNLIPGFPLDGGRVLRASLWRWTGSVVRATYLASRVGIAIAFGLIAIGAFQTLAGGVVSGVWIALIGLFLQHAANTAYAQTAITHTLGTLAVRDVMTRDVLAVDGEQTIAQVVEALWARHVSTVPVLADGTLVGVLSVGSLQTIDRERWTTTRVRDVMRPIERAYTAHPDDPLPSALRQATRNGLGRIAVLDRDRLVGYLSIKDIAHVLALRGVGDGVSAGVAGVERRTTLRRAA